MVAFCGASCVSFDVARLVFDVLVHVEVYVCVFLLLVPLWCVISFLFFMAAPRAASGLHGRLCISWGRAGLRNDPEAYGFDLF